MFFDKNNRFSILYISDSEEDEEKPVKNDISTNLKVKKIYLCNSLKKKDFSRKSYKKNIYSNYDIDINNKFLKIENNINKLLYNYKTNDKKPTYKDLYINHKRLGHISNSSISLSHYV